MTPEERRTAWNRDGFFIARGLIDWPSCAALLAEADALVRAHGEKAKAEAFVTTGAGAGGEMGAKRGAIIQRETNVGAAASNPEDYVSKIFSVHRSGRFRGIAADPRIVAVLGALMGPQIAIAQSQLIYKNPGAIGQPWHQDSFYFDFDRQPVYGMWLALTEATLENGCLHVLPGSQDEPIHAHEPDRRPGANMGYLEILDHDMSASVPVTMQPGDVLFFHSYLMHRSTDNVSEGRRAALVYHYVTKGTRMNRPNPVVDFMDVT